MRQAALVRQDLSCMYLAHHELESVLSLSLLSLLVSSLLSSLSSSSLLLLLLTLSLSLSFSLSSSVLSILLMLLYSCNMCLHDNGCIYLSSRPPGCVPKQTETALPTYVDSPIIAAVARTDRQSALKPATVLLFSCIFFRCQGHCSPHKPGTTH